MMSLKKSRLINNGSDLLLRYLSGCKATMAIVGLRCSRATLKTGC